MKRPASTESEPMQALRRIVLRYPEVSKKEIFAHA